MSDNVWMEVVDKTCGKKYYYNKKTRETSWEPPEGVTIIKKKAGSENQPDEWVASVDPNTGNTYYYNKRTKQTAWELPSGAKLASGPQKKAADAQKEETTPEEPAAATKSAAASTKKAASHRVKTGKLSPDGQWEEILDPTTTQKYWCHTVTKATAWVLPSSAQVAKEPEMPEALAKIVKPKPVEAQQEEKKPVEGEPENKGGVGGVVSSEVEKPKGFEPPSSRMKKLKEALQAKEAEGIAEEDSDEEDFEFVFAKHRHGWLNRTLRIGEVFDQKKLLSYKKSMIKKALLKKNRDLDREAVQAFKNVMSYMGDRKSSKQPMPHAKKLLTSALNSPSGLRDEIYLQLVKQTSKNPHVASNLKGWELMMFCLATFPPSKPLKKFLISFFQQNESDEQTEPTVRAFAKEGLVRLEKIILLGQRKEVPSTLELDCIKNQRPVPIRINTLDGAHKTISVDAYTFAKDVTRIFQNKLNLNLTLPFALYQASDSNEESILDPKDRVLDVVAAWEKGPRFAEKLSYDYNPERQMKKKERKEKVKMVKLPQFNKFLYKAKLMLKTSDPDILNDLEAVNLIYIQAVHDVVTFRYPVKEKDLAVLAALQLQATFGNQIMDSQSITPQWLQDRLESFIPVHLLEDKAAKGKRSDVLVRDWAQRVLVKYNKIKDFTSQEAKLNYLDFVKDWPFYGATFFEVEQRQFHDYPSPLLLGITCEGVILMHPVKKVLLENFVFTDIVTWGHSDERFIVVVGDVVQQRKLIFKSSEGKVMNQLIHDYVKFKVKLKAAAQVEV